jgi:D-psicose/D-tagatose/L-ribulose 3-epimerase
MKLGMNLLLWTDDATLESWLPLYERLHAMGFEGVEVPLFGPGASPEALARLGQRLDDIGLERTGVKVMNAEDDPISPDPSVRTAALRGLEHAVDCAEALGAELIAGPIYAAIGQFSGAGPTDDEWTRSVAVIQEAADYAAARNVSLALEFLNRFEIYLLNCADDTLRFVREVDRDNVGIHYDTFHANIEEKDPAAAIGRAGHAITHVHVSENDRSTPGRGQVRWDETFDALRRMGYDGWLTIEAFGGTLASLAAATKIWRPMFEDEETLAREGLSFMQREWARRRSG